MTLLARVDESYSTMGRLLCLDGAWGILYGTTQA